MSINRLKKSRKPITKIIPRTITTARFDPCTSSQIFPGGSSKLLLLPRINAVGASDTKKFPRFSLSKKAHAVEQRRAVSQDGAVGPFFEGDMPPQKIDPKKWRQPWRHSMNPVNSYFLQLICNIETTFCEEWIFELGMREIVPALHGI